MNKKIFITLAILLFIASNIFFGWPLINIYNNYKTNQYLNSLIGLKFSDENKVINSSKQFGILSGNSNHCDCEILAIIESTMEIPDFVTYIDKNLFLKAPFSTLGEKYSFLYFIENQNLYVLNDTTKIKLSPINNHQYYSIESDFDFYLSTTQYKAIVQLINSTLLKKNYNYYLISAFDQTYSGLSMKDRRCH